MIFILLYSTLSREKWWWNEVEHPKPKIKRFGYFLEYNQDFICGGRGRGERRKVFHRFLTTVNHQEKESHHSAKIATIFLKSLAFTVLLQEGPITHSPHSARGIQLAGFQLQTPEALPAVLPPSMCPQARNPTPTLVAWLCEDRKISIAGGRGRLRHGGCSLHITTPKAFAMAM